MTFRFRLLDTEGHDLGTLMSSRPNWQPGDEAERGGETLVIVAIVEPEDAMDARAYLVVEPAAVASTTS